MGVSSSTLHEQNPHEFMKLRTEEPDYVELPTPSSNRVVTDKKGFVIFGVLMLVLAPFMIYTLVKSDIRRLTHGHDNCANLCGVNNKKVDGVACSGKDYTNQPFEIINILTHDRTCESSCPPGYIRDGNTCYGDSLDDDTTKIENVNLWNYSLKLWWKFLIVIIINTILCIITLIVFRYIPGVVIWGVSVLGVLVAISLAVFFWVTFSRAEITDGAKQGYLALALLSTFFAIIILILFIIFIKRIQLIILLYKEAAKALFAMPAIVFLSVLTLTLQLLVLSLMITTTTYMGTSADLTRVESGGNYYYKMNGVMKFTLIFNLIVTLWALQFFSGCQYMVVSGSVAQWFFKKDEVSSPISISFINTMKFHLGTIAFGSFIITLIAVLKAIIKSLISCSKVRCLFDCCCGNIEALFTFLSKNAYIETGIYGQSFIRSGKRAANMLVKNVGFVFALNSIGGFVLAMLQYLLLVISTAIAYGIFLNDAHVWIATIISFLLNIVVVVIVFGVFDTIVDTLFICYSEDTAINDGTENKPYAMTTDSMQFIQKAKKLEDKDN